MQCPHLRETIRTERRRNGFGEIVVDVHGCERFGECTLSEPLHGRATCRTCVYGVEGREQSDEGRNRKARSANLSLSHATVNNVSDTGLVGDVTFGVVTFRRPRHCQQLVDSILRLYAQARILVADNGDKPPDLPNSVERLNLPFNCGISASRNALVRETTTPYFLLMDDDTIFHEPIVESFLDVLQSDAEVGVVACRVYDQASGKPNDWAAEMLPRRDHLLCEPTRREIRVTPRGTPYQIADMVHNNAALFRTEVLRENPWRGEIKIQEHLPFYWDLKLAHRWLAAHCYHISVLEDRRRDSDYAKIRHAPGRWKQQFEYLRARGFARGAKIHRMLQWYRQGPDSQRPNLIVLGVDHSGTTILTRMLMRLGWRELDADQQYAESVAVRRLNIDAIRMGRPVDQRRALQLLERPGPWVVKDPRFSTCLRDWLYPFSQLPRPPLLLWIQRDLDAVAESFHRRREHGGRERLAAQELFESAAENFHIWPWAKLAVSYEAIAQAVALFLPAESEERQS